MNCWCCRSVTAQCVVGRWWPVLPWTTQVSADRTELCAQLYTVGGITGTAVGHNWFSDKMERRSFDTRTEIEAAYKSTQTAGGWKYRHFI